MVKMVGLQLNDRLKGSLRKGMVVGGVACVLSLVTMNGLDGVNIMGQTVPLLPPPLRYWAGTR